MSAAERKAREARELHVASRGETRCGWVLWPAPGGGFSWCRVLIPVGQLEKLRSGEDHAPDQKGIALAKIELDMASESVVTRRGWL